MKIKNTRFIILLFAFMVFGQNTNAQSNLLDSSYHWQWNATQNAWVVKDKMLYTFDANNNPASSTRITFNTVNWISDWQYQFTYDSANHLTAQRYFDWTGTIWLNDLDWVYTYDSLGNQTNQLRKDWVSNSWRNDYQWFYTYDANHKLLNEIQQDWDANTAWLDILQNHFTYDIYDNQTSQLVQSWFNSSWVNNNLFLYSYDPQNNQLRREAQNWVVDHWEIASQYLYSYDANNNQLSRLYQTIPGTSWKNSNYYYYTYDASNNQTSWLRQNWVAGSWQYNFQYLYTYNAANKKITEVRTNWGTDEFVNADSTFYYYRNVIGIANVDATAGGLLMYPNPAINELTIDNGELKIKSIEIYNTLGEKVYTTAETSGNTSHRLNGGMVSINVSALRSGIYFVKVKTSEGMRAGKFVKE